MASRIRSDEEIFAEIKEKSRKAYQKCWKDFKDRNPEVNFEEAPPGEEILINFFKYLRTEKETATSSLWTLYSYLNSVCKRKYGFKLQTLPRVTMYIKGFEEDIKKKAPIMDEMQLKKFMMSEMPNAFMEVRQAVAILCFFGALRLIECLALKLEKIVRSPVGYTISHMRAKQRTDKVFTNFVVPEEGGYAQRLSIYLTKVNTQLNKYAGRVFHTGTQHSMLKRQLMGKNTVGLVPRDMAKYMNLPEWETYTFHSFRRTAATSAADAGSTTEQMVDFFGWKNGSMCQEYISTSKPAILGMASKLGAFEQVLSQDPVVEVDVEVEEAKEVAQEVAQEDPFKEMEFIVMEEDPEMYAMAGIQLVSVPVNVPVSVPSNIECTIRQALASVPSVSGNNTVNFNIVCGNFNGPVSF